MSVRFKVDGVDFEVDTPADAVEMVRLLRESLHGNGREKPEKQERPKQSTIVGMEMEGAGFASFVSSLMPNGIAVVRALSDAFPNQLTTDELSEKSKVANKALPPVMRHIRKAATKAGLDPDKTVIRATKFIDGGPVSQYTLAREVAEVVKEE